MTTSEDVWRRESPHILAALMRRFGDFAACEDAVQEALFEASQQWPTKGVPDKPRGWLLRVASRRLIDAKRQDSSRLERERRVFSRDRPDQIVIAEAALENRDSSLQILALCCHPSLSPDAQVTLTLRAVLGLSTDQIAALYLIPSATAGQRISRAKSTIDENGRHFPRPETTTERLPAMLHALYLMYTAGHSRPNSDDLFDQAVTDEAIRLARLLHAALPDETETAGLLALMLLSEARRPGRRTHAGELVTLRNQDRKRWNSTLVSEGVSLLEAALPTGPVGAYQLQAAISAVHSEATTWEETDWPQIVELYSMLARIAPSPTVTLNYAVAVSEVHGPRAALEMLEPLLADKRMSRSHRLHAVRAPILEAFGDSAEALTAYRTASRLCTNVPEQRYINAQITRLSAGAD
ncbi:RNA polymerase sigma factor [Brevibacterium sp. CSND-B09]|uniref:RNA polymerase sigma factor n=1 Tax=Brevibacterium sp. CSND-B09 TaxID=3462571 RepID=UPI00406A6F87